MANQEYEIYYWGGIGPGRVEFIRLIFEETGQPYKIINDNEVIMDMFFKGKPQQGYPALAPPMLKRGDFKLSQTPIICRYLGKHLGLEPSSDDDQWHAETVNITIHDYIAEGRNSFHGQDWKASYFTQVEETKPYVERFEKNRIPYFMKYFESIVKANHEGKGYLYGDKITYVDLALLHILRATEAQFPETWKNMDYIPLLKAYKERIMARPNLAAYFKSDRSSQFSGNSMM